MAAPSFTVTIHGSATYQHFAPNHGFHTENCNAVIQPFGLLAQAIEAAEQAIALSDFDFCPLAHHFTSERISIHDRNGSLIFAARVSNSTVTWISPATGF